MAAGPPTVFRAGAGAGGAAHVAGNTAPVLLAELQVVFLTLREDVPHEGVESRVRAEAALDAGEQPLGVVLRQVCVRS